MTQDRRRQVRTLAAIAFVVLGHAALITVLALAGEWRVWRFIMNATAQLYALAGMGWLGWQAFAAPAQAQPNTQARVMTAGGSTPGAVMLPARWPWSRLGLKTLRGRCA